MATFSPLIDNLIDALRCLPGVGPKTAQRMVFHLLERARDKGIYLGNTLLKAMEQIRHCQRCRTFCEEPICRLCQSPQRDASLLCIVESPADVLAMEYTASFRGFYFVLMGHLSPLDGIGPGELGLDLLLQRLQTEPFHEVILATNPTVEGEATAHYIADLLQGKNLKVSRIAHGVPIGGELEYIDSTTLSRAIESRELLF